MKVTPLSSVLSFSLLAAPIATQETEFQAVKTSARRMKQLLADAPRLWPIGSYVGELQEKWAFTSDHLPIGMQCDNLNYVSWNVLDAAYMDWVIEKNSQGLSRSQIAAEHVPLDGTALTVRDRHVVDQVLEMLSRSNHLLNLQECSRPFLKELRARLPADYKVIAHRGQALVIDGRVFEPTEVKEIFGVFSDTPGRSFQDIRLRRLDTGEIVRVVNVHLPGDPDKPGRFEFARYLATSFDPNATTIAMGDMNFNEREMEEALRQASAPYALYTPYCTNISPHSFVSKAIDHFLVASPKSARVELRQPDQLLGGLNEIVALLN